MGLGSCKPLSTLCTFCAVVGARSENRTSCLGSGPTGMENAPAEKNSAPVRVSVRTPMESGVLACVLWGSYM